MVKYINNCTTWWNSQTIAQLGEIQKQLHNMMKFTNNYTTWWNLQTIEQHDEIHKQLNNMVKYTNNCTTWWNLSQQHPNNTQTKLTNPPTDQPTEPFPELLKSIMFLRYSFSWVLFGCCCDKFHHVVKLFVYFTMLCDKILVYSCFNAFKSPSCIEWGVLFKIILTNWPTEPFPELLPQLKIILVV